MRLNYVFLNWRITKIILTHKLGKPETKPTDRLVYFHNNLKSFWKILWRKIKLFETKLVMPTSPVSIQAASFCNWANPLFIVSFYEAVCGREKILLDNILESYLLGSPVGKKKDRKRFVKRRHSIVIALNSLGLRNRFT